jgi:hypothetical protein
MGQSTRVLALVGALLWGTTHPWPYTTLRDQDYIGASKFQRTVVSIHGAQQSVMVSHGLVEYTSRF